MDLWLWTEKDKLFLKSYHTKYEIDNKSIVQRMGNRFDKLSDKPILVSEDDLLKDTLDNQMDMVCKKIYRAIVYKAPDYIERQHSEEVINLCSYSSVEEMLEVVDKYKQEEIRVIFNTEKNVAAMYEYKKVIKDVISNIAKASKRKDWLIQKIAITKAKNLQRVEGLISYTVVDNDTYTFHEKLLFPDLVNTQKEMENIRDIVIPQSIDINAELNEINTLFEKMDRYIDSFGFGELYEIPFKLSSFNYCINSTPKKTFATGNKPGEVYVRAIKMGMADMLGAHLDDQDSRWVMAQNKLDILIEGVLPLLFAKLAIDDSEAIEKKLVSTNEIKHVVLDLLKRNKNFEIDDLSITINTIKDTALKEGVLSNTDTEIKGYGIDDNEIITALLIQYYALAIQNNLHLKTRVGNNYDLHGEDEELLTNSIVNDIEKVNGKLNKYEIDYLEWKYNNLLEKSNMKCLKVIIRRKQ